MKYIVAADTDIGISKNINQDSLCVKIADTDIGKVALFLVCDGMGGLSKGEVASAAVVKSFSDWFDNELPYEINSWDWNKAKSNVELRLRKLNSEIVAYGKRLKLQSGTTATGVIAVNSRYLSFHVGDCRLYKISYELQQMTEDHTFINDEIKSGRMTYEQAQNDCRRNAITQCIGVNNNINPVIETGTIETGVNYLICTDGFRHVITENEIFDNLSSGRITTKSSMQAKIRELIELNKLRNEHDNISALMFRAEPYNN